MDTVGGVHEAASGVNLALVTMGMVVVVVVVMVVVVVGRGWRGSGGCRGSGGGGGDGRGWGGSFLPLPATQSPPFPLLLRRFLLQTRLLLLLGGAQWDLRLVGLEVGPGTKLARCCLLRWCGLSSPTLAFPHQIVAVDARGIVAQFGHLRLVSPYALLRVVGCTHHTSLDGSSGLASGYTAGTCNNAGVPCRNAARGTSPRCSTQ